MTKSDSTTKPLRIHQTIARKVGIAILTGEFAPGDRFDGEIEKSLELGVSRTAYREAMRILIAKGLVESLPKKGTHVTPRSRWNLLDPDILAWMFAQKPDETFIRDLFELRGILEPAAAALAAERRSNAQIAAMADALDRMRRYGLAVQQGQEADQEFHHVLLEATGNEALASLASSVGAAVQWTTHFKQRASTSPRDPIPDHEAVYNAIAMSDPSAAAVAMKALLNLALDDMAVVLR